MTETNQPAAVLNPLRLLAYSLMASPVLVLLSCMRFLSHGFDEPPLWTLLVVVGHGILTAGLLQTVGYATVKPIPPGTAAGKARDLSRAALSNHVIVTFAIVEAVAVVALVLAFVVDAGGVTVLTVGTILTEAMAAWRVWPGDRVIAGVQEALERGGSHSYLREAIGNAEV